jgi:molecular chaperone Hsp33
VNDGATHKSTRPGETDSRFVSDEGHDDKVLPFAVEPLDLRGRIVRLGTSVDQILAGHKYPAPVARLLGEAAALTVLLGTSLKFDGRFQLQTRTDGPVDMIVVDFDAPNHLRAFARYNADRLAQVQTQQAQVQQAQVQQAQLQHVPGQAAEHSAALLGKGHLAFTIEQGNDASRYQGIVALEGQGFEEAAHQYFRQSEQIPTLVRLAVAENLTGSGTAWRAGGLMVQFLPAAPERRHPLDLSPGDVPEGTIVPDMAEDDAWVEAKALVGTVEDHELVDPTLSSERLLYRLFHESGVKVFETQSVRAACRCSRDRIAAMLRSFTPQERKDMIGDDGKIGVTCEFCSTFRAFDPAEFEPV